MQHISAPRPVASSHQAFPLCPPETGNGSRHETEDRVDYEFVAMLDGYRCSGGLARFQEVLSRFEARCRPQASTLESQIIGRKVIRFQWQSQTWLPLFQFRPIDMAPLPELGPVMMELTAAYDNWELAVWFAQPNPWLSDRVPADLLVSDLPAVLNAARADRYIARGG